MATATSNSAKKKRVTKDLPDGLSELTEANFRKSMLFRLEADPKSPGENMVAYKWKLRSDCNDEDETTQFDLEKGLTLDQLRQFCRKVGCPFIHTCNKYQCRKALAILANHQERRERDGEKFSTVSERATNNIVRMTNIIFSNNFLEPFLALNDIKKRIDHEVGMLPNEFWNEVAEAMNGALEDDNSPLDLVISEEDPHYGDLLLLDLDEYDLMTSEVMRKKFNMLLKVRRVMIKDMTTSGEHGNDPYNFVDVAMKKAGGTGLTTLGCYYFFLRCSATPAIDVSFAVAMEPALMGSTRELPVEDLDMSLTRPSTPSTIGSTMSAQKKRAFDAAMLVDVAAVGTTMAVEMKETNKIAKETVQEMKEQNGIAKEKNRLSEEKNRLASEADRTAKQSQLIQLAQHLGRNEILETILQNLSGSTS